MVCEKNTHAMTLYVVCEKNTHAMTLDVVCEKNKHAMTFGGSMWFSTKHAFSIS